MNKEDFKICFYGVSSAIAFMSHIVAIYSYFRNLDTLG